MARPTVALKKPPSFQELKRIAANLKSARVRVGFPKGSAGSYPDGTDVVDVALWNEFGTSRIPERPFFRTAIDKNQKKYIKWGRDLARKVLEGRVNVFRAMGLLGEEAKADIQMSITRWRTPANSEATIQMKGSSKPLIDTGQMRSSVTYKVEGMQ